MPSLFPFADYWWLYLSFTVGILALLALDLGVCLRQSHKVGFLEAAAWCAVWVTLALIFNVALYFYSVSRFPQDTRLMSNPPFAPTAAARQVAFEFLSGYLV